MSSASDSESSGSDANSSSSSSASLAIENTLTEFINAVKAGQAEDVELLLREKDADFDIEGRDKFGRTALMLAAEYGHTSIAKLLLEAGANVNARKTKALGKEDKSAKKRRGRAPIAYAALYGHVEVLKLLLEPQYGADVNLTEAEDWTALHLAVEDDNLTVVQLLLERGANVECRTNYGRTPLHLAAVNGNTKLAQLLLDNGAYIEAKTRQGGTPLLVGFSTGHESVVRMLLEAGANARSADAFGDQSLHIAAANGFTVGVELLLNIGVIDIESTNYVRATPLHSAARRGHLAVVLLLLNKGANFNAKDTLDANDQQTPFDKAILYGHAAIARALIGAGFDFDALSSSTKIALLHKAASNGHRDCVQLLIRKGVDPMAASLKNGNTALHLSAKKGHEEVVRLLIEEGVDIMAKNFAGKTALDNAKDEDKVLRLLTVDRPLVGKPEIIENLSQSTHGNTEQAQFSRKDLASMSFDALILEVSLSNKEYLNVFRPSVYDLIYGNGPTKIMGKGHDSRSRSNFRWYHLPANNMAWMQDLLQRISRENYEEDSELKDKQAFFDWQQQEHRGSAPHACFMRPKCKIFEDHRKDNGKGGNVELYMPYLSFEFNDGRVKLYEATKSLASNEDRDDADSELIKTYLHSFAAKSLTVNVEPLLHVRRTLDQFLYYALDDTSVRDQDQVVYRYTKPTMPQLFMVDQLWLWIFDAETIITCFPQRWNQPENDEHDVVHYIFEELRSDKRRLISSVYDLAILITNCCANFVKHCLTTDSLPLTFLEVYESSIGIVTHEETKRFSTFNALLSASAKSPFAKRQSPSLDELFNITSETQLLTEIRDIRDELNMLRMIIKEQISTVPVLIAGVHNLATTALVNGNQDLATTVMKNSKQRDKINSWVKSNYGTWLAQSASMLENRLDDVEKMDRLALRTDNSLNQLLDLKQRQANGAEARYARLQAEDVASQGRTVMVFTFVTIVFLPLSFMASFFAINISEFPKENDGGLQLAYVCRYLVSISVALIVPMVLIALNISHISNWLQYGAEKYKVIFTSQSSAAEKTAMGSSGRARTRIRELCEITVSSSDDRSTEHAAKAVPLKPLLHSMRARTTDLEGGGTPYEI